MLSRSLERAVRVANEMPESGLLDIELAHLYALAGRTGGLPELSLTAAKYLSPTAVEDGLPIIRHTDAATRALVSYENNDHKMAQKSLKDLGRHGGLLVIGSLISVDRLKGLISRTLGRIEDSVEHFDSAITRSRSEGRKPHLAWACFEYAEMLLERGDAGDRGKASGLLDDALAITGELGMTPLKTRVIALREQIPARRGGSTHPDGLTARQVDVLSLVAAGRTNQEIADELVISIHTVLRHMQNIFGKIGVYNRTEAAAYAVRHGLDSGD